MHGGPKKGHVQGPWVRVDGWNDTEHRDGERGGGVLFQKTLHGAWQNSM